MVDSVHDFVLIVVVSFRTLKPGSLLVVVLKHLWPQQEG